MLTVLLVVSALFVSMIAMYFTIDQCAKANFLFTYAKEGTAKAIVSSEAFERIIFAYKGDKKMYIDSEWELFSKTDIEQILRGEKEDRVFAGPPTFKEEKTEKDKMAKLEERHHSIDEFLRTNWLAKRTFGENHGLRWVGLPPYHKVYEYKFTWTSKTIQGEERKREEIIDNILIQEDIYLIKLENVEDKNLIPLDINMFVTLRIVNPYKALFRVQSWLEMITDTLRGICVPYIGRQSFAEMVSGAEKDSTAESKGALAKYIWDNLTKDPEKNSGVSEHRRFMNDYGVRIKSNGIRVESIDPPKDYAEEITKGAIEPWLGERTAKAINKRYAPFIGRETLKKIKDSGERNIAITRMMEIRRLEALEKISESGNLILDVDKTKGLMIDTTSKKGEKK